MPHEFKLSAFGLKLIKAYEGFRPAEMTLVSGQRVIGYGHRVADGEEAVMTKSAADTQLKQDLSPYEAMINDNVFAPLTQSQFDALVSFSFNIGPKAFLESRILHALNQGRPLEAANGLDAWCKSKINGQVYVVDALVRRRTAEKSLFLRPNEGVVSAPRIELPAMSDRSRENAQEEIPYFDKADAETIVDQTPYDSKPAQFRRRDDQPAGILTLSERLDNNLDDNSVATGAEERHKTHTAPQDAVAETSIELSPIALAANEVSARLDKLMAEEPARTTQAKRKPEPIKPDHAKPASTHDKPIAANEGVEAEYTRPSKSAKPIVRGPDAFIQRDQDKNFPAAPNDLNKENMATYWVMLFIGLAMLGFGIYKWFIETPNTLAGWTVLAVSAMTMFGGLLVLASIYYLLKDSRR